MITRNTITQMLSHEITEAQCSDSYDFNGDTISWVPGQESYCLTQNRKTYWASPGDIEDLIDRLDGDDLEEWFNDRYDGYPASEVLEAILAVVGTELEAA